MSLQRYATVPVQVLFLVATLITLGCSSATYIKASVPDNPIERVAQEAQHKWSVEQVNDTTLQLSDSWPIYSVLALGYGASYANVSYDPSGSELSVQYYFKAHPLMTLWIPTSIDAEPGFYGAALKPIMNMQINEIMKWSGATITSRRAGSRSDTFPVKAGKPPTPDK
jgi:hypothetical protein